MDELLELRQRVAESERKLRVANETIRALTENEIDTSAPAGAVLPILLQKAQQKLRTSEQLLRAVFDGALEPMVLTDHDGKCVDANPAACELHGLTRGQLIGRSIGFTGPQMIDDVTYRAFREQGHMRGRAAVERADGTRVLEYSALSDVAAGLDLSVMRDITDRTAAEEARRRNEALFRAVIEKSAEVISLTAADGATRYLTPSVWRLLGWAPEETSPQTLRDQVIPEDRAHIATALDRLVRTGARDTSMEFRVRHRDGSIRWIEASSTNLLDDPDVCAIVGNYRDITARKRAEEALRESRDQLEEAQAIAHIGSWASGIGPSETVSWSRECYRIFGLAVGTPMTVASFFAQVHPEDRERVRSRSRDATENGVPYDVEHRVVRPDGRVRYVHERAAVERDETGRALRIIGTVQDITERHAAVTALRESEERYRRIVETTSEGVWTYDAEGVTTFMNARMATMLGCTVEEAVGKPIYGFMNESDRTAAQARIQRRQKGVSERSDFKLRRTDGTELWCSIEANPLFDVTGRFEAALALVTDVSTQRRAEEDRARLAAIVESAEDAIFSRDREGRIVSWNAGAERLYGYAASEMIGQVSVGPVPPDRHDEVSAVLKSIDEGGSVARLETVSTRKDGTHIDVAITITAIKDAAGRIVGTSLITRDMTARRKTEAALRLSEEQLRQAQKMEAIGTLAGAIAHDFNNLLSIIMSYTSLVIDEMRPEDPVRCDLEEVRKAAARAGELTRQLLTFSRQQMLSPYVLDLNPIVAGLQKMLARLLGEGIVLSVLPSENLGRVHADPGQLEQVIMNLVVNARDAMPRGGSLTIETSNVRLDDEYASAHRGVTPGPYVMLAVTDTGEGMSRATVARIFEPFFTTKEKGKGTGLGLATVYGIVHQSGGHIWVYSEPGVGTTFKIYLPRTDRVADRVHSILPKKVVLRGTETVLIVEDEEQVRAIMRSILQRNGYNVLDAQNGGEAFLICEKFAAKIHMLITDVVMPRMSGRDLAERLLSVRPAMKVLFVSGYTEDSIVHHGVLDAGIAFLPKPITPDALLRKVRQVLDPPEWDAGAEA